MITGMQLRIGPTSMKPFINQIRAMARPASEDTIAAARKRIARARRNPTISAMNRIIGGPARNPA
jgi:hypothetical protein